MRLQYLPHAPDLFVGVVVMGPGVSYRYQLRDLTVAELQYEYLRNEPEPDLFPKPWPQLKLEQPRLVSLRFVGTAFSVDPL